MLLGFLSNPYTKYSPPEEFWEFTEHRANNKFPQKPTKNDSETKFKK